MGTSPYSPVHSPVHMQSRVQLVYIVPVKILQNPSPSDQVKVVSGLPPSFQLNVVMEAYTAAS